MIGPFFLEHAKRGMTLAIRFNRIVPGRYGFTSAGQYPNWQNQKLHLTDERELTLDWALDPEKMEGSCQIDGATYSVPLRPFMGIVSMPPEETGIHSDLAAPLLRREHRLQRARQRQYDLFADSG
ncbi:hypothetical protein VQ056_13415 [Paenibacillus sp. JTLBN-2024]